METSSNGVAYSSVFPPPGSGDSSNALMEAERSGGVAGGTNQSPAGSGAGRNPNGPKAMLGPAPSAAAAAAAGAMAGSSQPRDPQDGDAGLSLPGILHFIQYEWSRFQAEKYRWEAERDELRVKNGVSLIACFGLFQTDSLRKSSFADKTQEEVTTACYCR